MKFIIRHEIKGRIRVHMVQNKMTCEEADRLYYYIRRLKNVTEAKVFERTADVSVTYVGSRDEIIQALKTFCYEKTEVPEEVLKNSGRALNASYQEKLIGRLLLRAGSKLFLPRPVRAFYAGLKSIKYLFRGIRCLRRESWRWLFWMQRPWASP